MSTFVNVAEVFDTIQGEATFTGTPSWFVRLQGCDVGCPFCDTKYTWAFGFDKDLPDSLEASGVRVKELMDRLTKGDVYKADPSAKGLRVNIEHLIHHLRKLRPGINHIVLTGGEPMAQHEAVSALCAVGMSMGYQMQIETSGTYPIALPSPVWVTVSPKVGMPGGRVVLEASLDRADEIKFPVGKQEDVDKLKKLLADNGLGDIDPGLVWLQPISQNKAATELCVQTCFQEGWRLSLQTHKYIGLA